MQINLEGQPLCEGAKTGIGWYIYNLVSNLLRTDTENEYHIHLFDFLKRNRSTQVVNALFTGSLNTFMDVCSYFPYSLYSNYNRIFGGIPYNFLTGSSRGVYHFFQFVIPRSIKGPVINTVYDMVLKIYPETMEHSNYEKLNRELTRSCKQADLILTISENSKKEIAEFMDITKEKIQIAYPAVDHSIFYPRENIATIKDKYGITGEYLLYLGTLEPRKNITMLIDAFHIIAQKNRDITLVIAGKKGWQYEDIFSKVTSLKLESRICFTGYVGVEDIPALYSGAVAFIFPSLYEGFGMPPLEAMACGTPVIVSNTSSLPEVVGDAGILVNPKEPENLAFEMNRLLNDTKLRQELSQKGLLRSQAFSWEDSAKKVIDIYKSLA